MLECWIECCQNAGLCTQSSSRRCTSHGYPFRLAFHRHAQLLVLASPRSYTSSYILAKYTQVPLSDPAHIRRAYPATPCNIPLILPHTRYNPR
jgi:hypothetical protein